MRLPLRYNDFMLVNQPVPDFQLQDLYGTIHQLSDYRGKIVILNFWSAECPHSERADRDLLVLLERWKREVVLLSIAPNRNEPAQMLETAARARKIPTLLIDAEHAVADLFEAVTTPHVFVVDREGILRYLGAVDDITFRRRKAGRFFLREALEALLEGRLPERPETPAYGCAIVREI